VLTVIAVISKLIIIPLFKTWKLGKTLSYEQAATIIGNHFAEIKDKLLNTLQLNELSENSNKELVQAGIDQKIQSLKPIPFTGAIDLKKNRKYLPLALIPAGTLIILLFAAPNVIKESTSRLVNYNVTYKKTCTF
jgi:hypothetical protein